jgi:hypothetical protein
LQFAVERHDFVVIDYATMAFMGFDAIRFDSVEWGSSGPLPRNVVDEKCSEELYKCLNEIGIAFATKLIAEYAFTLPLFTIHIDFGDMKTCVKRSVYRLPFHDFPAEVFPSLPLNKMQIGVDVTPGVNMTSTDLMIRSKIVVVDLEHYELLKAASHIN